MVEQDMKYINILDKKNIPVPKEQWENVRDNPEGLTVEGVKFNVNEWKRRSKNKHVVAKYNRMLRECKNLTSSGKLSDGKTILSRDVKGTPTWTEMIDENFDLVSSGGV